MNRQYFNTALLTLKSQVADLEQASVWNDDLALEKIQDLKKKVEEIEEELRHPQPKLTSNGSIDCTTRSVIL